MGIQVIKSKRKTIGLEVHTDGRVILRAPTMITNRELNKFIDNHMSWIESKLSLIEKKNADKISVAPPKETISILLQYYGSQCQQNINKRPEDTLGKL